MAIFPNLGPQYYDEQHKGLLSRMETFYADSITINQSYWSEADTDTRFESGDQTVWDDVFGNLPANRRRQFNFNRIRRIINMVSGHQRRNRKSTIVVPVDNGDQETADQFSKIMLSLNRQEGILETISEAFHGGALVSGMNLLQVWMDYRSDPVSGDIKVNKCSYNEFLIDPFFRKADLSDCNGIWKRSWLTKREVLSLLPDKTDAVMGLQGQNNRDGKFQFMPESYNYGMRNLLTYDEFYYRDYRTQKILVDSQTGETFEWRIKDKDKLNEFLAFYPQITVIDQEIPTVKLAIVVQGRVMYDGPNPMGIDKYPFVPVLGYYNPQLPYFPWRIQGMVRGLRDPQFLYNRRKVIELDILESQINSGWKYKENALVNPKDIFLTGQGRGLAIKEDAAMTDVEQIQAIPIPASTIQLSEIMGREMQEISGVNEELLGSATDDKAGILSMLRQGAGLTTLQILFDQLDNSQKLLGKLIIDLVQANYTPGKVKRMVDAEPTAQFYNKAFGKYDAAIEEGLNTTTQKQMRFAQLLQLREVGVPIPDEELLESATLQNKNKLVESVSKRSQAMQEQQKAQNEAAVQELQSRVERNSAKSIADKSLGAERLSRIPENKAFAEERREEAHRDHAAAVLDMVRAMKELDDMDINQIQRLFELSRRIKQEEEPTSILQQPRPVNNLQQLFQ